MQGVSSISDVRTKKGVAAAQPVAVNCCSLSEIHSSLSSPFQSRPLKRSNQKMHSPRPRPVYSRFIQHFHIQKLFRHDEQDILDVKFRPFKFIVGSDISR